MTTSSVVIREAEGQDLGHVLADLTWRKIDYGGDLPADDDCRGHNGRSPGRRSSWCRFPGPKSMNRTYRPECGLRESHPYFEDGADPDIDFQKIVEADVAAPARLAHGRSVPVRAEMKLLVISLMGQVAVPASLGVRAVTAVFSERCRMNWSQGLTQPDRNVARSSTRFSPLLSLTVERRTWSRARPGSSSSSHDLEHREYRR